MCESAHVTENVGAHKLVRDFNRYLQRVRAGERLIVTERGEPVAVVSPWVEEGDILDHLVVGRRMRHGSGGSLASQPLGGTVFRTESETSAE